MSGRPTGGPWGRVLLLAPTAKDAELSRRLLEDAGIGCLVCKDLQAVCDAIEAGAGAALLTQEAILADAGRRLAGALGRQPPWSDFPLVVLTPAGADSPRASRALEAIGHMTLVKRPISIDALISTVRAALRDRARQYETRDFLLERERDAEHLRLSEGKFRQLAESIPQLAWMARPDGHIFWYNRRWYDYTGTTPADMEGWGWKSVHDPEALPRVLERWSASIASGDPFDMVFPLRGADGRFRPFLTRVMPLRDDGGGVAAWFGTNTDIAERVEMEAALKEADRRKDEFLAMLAHELRNPLAAVNNAVTVLKMSGDEENRNWASDVVERQVKQLARLIDDLLDVSRITSGKIRLRVEHVDAAPIVDHALETVRPLIDARGHRLVVDVDRGGLPLDADPTRLEQVVVNLLTNAAKYTESGGRIEVSAGREGGDVVIRVRDDGIGIPPEKLPEMFQLFAQGERSIARSEGGLGIGLTIVRRLAEMHGGSASAASPGPGGGSEFTVRLPAATGPGAPAAPAGAATGPRKRARILIVDDSVDTARGMARLLTLVGNEVRVAHDGPTGVEACRDFRPEFVLLDIGLPGMDGFEVAAALRRDESCRGATIIGITGYGQDEDRRRSRAAGFDHHLVKPVDFDALTSLLARAE